MKLLEYYANHFKKYGDLKSVNHPYTKNVIRKNEPCMFNKVCSSTNTLMIMSSRKGDDIFYVCEDCALVS